jgi:hypothetical protein
MFSNVATFSVTNSPYLLQKRRLIFFTFLPDILMTI